MPDICTLLPIYVIGILERYATQYCLNLCFLYFMFCLSTEIQTGVLIINGPVTFLRQLVHKLMFGITIGIILFLSVFNCACAQMTVSHYYYCYYIIIIIIILSFFF